MRAASPQICCGCYRLHIRLPSEERLTRQHALVTAVEWSEPDVRLYVSRLFDHLTLGRKVFDPVESDQLHPTPPVPRTWTAEELHGVDILVVRHAFGIVSD